MNWLSGAGIVVVTVAAMELTAALVHRHVMHGPGWGWHKSHHQPRRGLLEGNDLYALVFAGISILFFVLGGTWPALWWIGLGMVVYGLLYGLVHDGLVHRRFPFLKPPRKGYVKRLVQAHRLHHAVHEKDGAVSFGFLYAAPIPRLIGALRANRDSR